MGNESLRHKTFNGMQWGLLDNIANSGVTFLVGLILARMLTPTEFGILGIITIFINLSIVIIDGGFATALIRKPEANSDDYNTVFYANIIISVGLIFILYLTSGAIADFFRQPQLAQVLPAMSIILLFNACSLIQKTILVKQLDFKSQALVSFVSSTTSGIIGIAAAFHGFGVWSLALQQISRQFIMMVGLWIANHWIPAFRFSAKSFHELFGFGSKILIANVINSIYKDMFLAVIGKMYTARDLGYYNRAEQFNMIFSNNLGQIVQKVSLSALSQVQHDSDRLYSSLRKMTRYVGIFTFAAVFGLSAVAKPLIITLVGSKWEPSVHLLQIMCIYAAIYPLQQLNLNILNIRKRSDLFLKLEILKKLLFTFVILVGCFYQLEWMLWAAVIYYYIEYILNSWYSHRFTGYGTWQQVKDLLPFYLISIAISLCVWTITLVDIPYLLMLPIQIFGAVILYIIVYSIIRQPEFLEVRQACINRIMHK
ncbi:MAG: lipopolysaccharide biosynthesis protein [Bacteroidaceae bacterium]|nr:lipopolysaccharide biosynthesis protein [Bacteroidaceae bacterium]